VGDAERQHQVRRLVRAALELQPPERSAFLAALADDRSLREEVESLIASYEQGETVIDEPSAEHLADVATRVREDVVSGAQLKRGEFDVAVGSRIGPYRVVREIGRGGMGVVFEAEQEEPIRRTVALKLVKWGMDTRAVIARFESERQALALMNHPYIANVLDAGATEQGRLFFAMEYVKGVPITEYCDKHRLTIRERLELFVRVCEGIQHAHQKGILHRDIKPSNVLVSIQDDKAIPKIIDFGLAKAISQRLTEKTIYTELGQLVGTPEYMSPEQAEMTNLDIDTRTDVYSLGVMLYELLVGARPFEEKSLRQAGFYEITRRIREDDPPRPSARLSGLAETSTATAAKRRVELPTLEKQLRGDLDWVTMKALEKDRIRRYGSAHDLAKDVQRHLSNEPVQARPPSLAYTLGKFVRRNRVVVAAACLVLAAVLAGLAAASVGFLRARQERDLAEKARSESEAVTDFLAGMLAAADPSELGKDVTVRQVLDQADAPLGERFAEQPLIEARLRGTIGETYVALGLYTEAEPHLRRAFEIQNELQPGEQPERLKAIHNLALLYRNQGRFDESEPLSVEALEGARRALGEQHPQTLAAMHSLASLYVEQGRQEEAEALYLQTLALRTRVLGAEHDDTLSTKNNLGWFYKELGRFDEAEELLAGSLDVHRRLFGDEHPDTIIALNNLASLYSTSGRYLEAEALYVEALDLCHRLLGEDHPHTLANLNNLAGLYSDQGRYDEAGTMLTEALEIQRRTLGDEHSDTLTSLVNLGVLRARQGRLVEAEPLLTEALETRRRVLGEEHPDTLYTMSILAATLSSFGKYDAAEALLRETYEVERRVLGLDNIDTLYALGSLAHALCEQGKFAEAESHFVSFNVAAPQALPDDSPIVLAFRGRYGNCLTRMGKHEQAEPLLLDTLSKLRASLGEDHQRVRDLITYVVALYESWGKAEEAATYRAML
jgi:serine/threonine protein kinase/tetratricopeptide (TPR) repeat protein